MLDYLPYHPCNYSRMSSSYLSRFQGLVQIEGWALAIGILQVSSLWFSPNTWKHRLIHLVGSQYLNMVQNPRCEGTSRLSFSPGPWRATSGTKSAIYRTWFSCSESGSKVPGTAKRRRARKQCMSQARRCYHGFIPVM